MRVKQQEFQVVRLLQVVGERKIEEESEKNHVLSVYDKSMFLI